MGKGIKGFRGSGVKELRGELRGGLRDSGVKEER